MNLDEKLTLENVRKIRCRAKKDIKLSKFSLGDCHFESSSLVADILILNRCKSCILQQTFLSNSFFRKEKEKKKICVSHSLEICFSRNLFRIFIFHILPAWARLFKTNNTIS